MGNKKLRNKIKYKNLPRICLNMIVKNESKVILECLESVVGFIDYYVINDTGSTDGTQKIIKDFFDSKKIKGEIIEHEFRTCKCHGKQYKKYKWFHFGWNRDYALKKCFGKSQYIFFIDADDIVTGEMRFPKDLDADQYYLCIQGGNQIYYRPQLIRNDPAIEWFWEYGLHEILSGKNIIISYKLLGDYAIHSRRLGNRNEDPLKYHKDIECLTELVAEFPTNWRYLRYLAQSYFDIGDWNNAIIYYKNVLEHETIQDVLYTSRYNIAMAHVNKKAELIDIVRTFEECAEKHPDRAEPLYYLCNYFNSVEEYEKAYKYGRKGLGIPFPNNSLVYIDKDVYDYKLLDELVFCASELKKYREALEWSKKLIEEERCPIESIETVQNNIRVLSSMM